MANKRISDLPAANPLAGTELIKVIQEGNSRKATAAQMATAGHNHDSRYYTQAQVDALLAARMVFLSQEEYDALDPKDPNTVYMIEIEDA